MAMGGARAANNSVPGWDPNACRDLSTLQIMTIGPEEGEHWSRLWLVAIDGRLYISLNDRERLSPASRREQRHQSPPCVVSPIGFVQNATYFPLLCLKK